jgi:hypothetical protein
MSRQTRLSRARLSQSLASQTHSSQVWRPGLETGGDTKSFMCCMMGWLDVCKKRSHGVWISGRGEWQAEQTPSVQQLWLQLRMYGAMQHTVTSGHLQNASRIQATDDNAKQTRRSSRPKHTAGLPSSSALKSPIKLRSRCILMNGHDPFSTTRQVISYRLQAVDEINEEMQSTVSRCSLVSSYADQTGTPLLHAFLAGMRLFRTCLVSNAGTLGLRTCDTQLKHACIRCFWRGYYICSSHLFLTYFRFVVLFCSYSSSTFIELSSFDVERYTSSSDSQTDLNPNIRYLTLIPSTLLAEFIPLRKDSWIVLHRLTFIIGFDNSNFNAFLYPSDGKLQQSNCVETATTTSTTTSTL